MLNDLKKIREIKVNIVVALLILFLAAAIFFEQFFVGIGVFFVSNGKDFREVYVNTILILLTIFIPVGMKMISDFKKAFPGKGAEIFLKEIVGINKFYYLIPVFSFLLFFDSSEFFHWFGLIHIAMFFVWVTLFLEFSDVLYRCFDFWISSGSKLNVYFYKHLKKSYSDVRNSVDFDSIAEMWISVWQTIGQLKISWKEKFLLLFWSQQKKFFGAGRYDLVGRLFDNFSEQFLSLSKDVKDDQKKYSDWLNERRRYLWFHGGTFDDGRENPYGIFERLLEFYYKTWERIELLRKETSSSERRDDWNSIELSRRMSAILEKIVFDELEHSDDYYFGFFRILKSHMRDKTQEYINSIPIYRAVFEHADTYNLSRYEPGEKNDIGFPNEWRIVDSEKEFSPIQVAWINKFFRWSSGRISHGEKPYDEKLSSALEMLFPEAYQPWLALGIAYRYLSWGGDRVASLCEWQRNFGLESGVFMLFDWNQEISDAKKERERDRFMNERIESFQKNALKILERLGILDDTFKKSKETLELLKFEENSYQEKNRKDLLEMLNLYES